MLPKAKQQPSDATDGRAAAQERSGAAPSSAAGFPAAPAPDSVGSARRIPADPSRLEDGGLFYGGSLGARRKDSGGVGRKIQRRTLYSEIHVRTAWQGCTKPEGILEVPVKSGTWPNGASVPMRCRSLLR